MRELVKATLSNDLSSLSLARLIVCEAARMLGFEGAALSQLEVAFEEAVTNVMKHAFDVEENASFDLACERIPEGIKVVIKERGIPFDPRQVPHYIPPTELDQTAAGMGLFLMRAMLDDCQFVNLGPHGKETHLIKYLKKGTVVAAEAPRATSEQALIQEKIAYDVRLMKGEEAIEVSRCAYKSHGYSFFDDHIYYPERLVELNENGAMISAVAVTEDDVFMGHAALLYQSSEDRIAELTFVFVNVEYRGQGAFGRLNDFLMKTPKRREFAGMYAYVVANHVFAQKTMARYGINDCGLLLATSPMSWKFKGIPGDASQRISVILSFRYMDEPRRLTLYPPPHHRAMIEKLYLNLGAQHDYEAAPRQLELPDRPSDLSFETNLSEGCAEIFLKSYGRNVVPEVRKLLRSSCLQQLAAVNIFLNLQDPATAVLTEEFEKLGFFFSGILPCARVGDTLILQYLNNVDLDYDKVTACSDMAKEMLGYIRQHDPNEACGPRRGDRRAGGDGHETGGKPASLREDTSIGTVLSTRRW